MTLNQPATAQRLPSPGRLRRRLRRGTHALGLLLLVYLGLAYLLLPAWWRHHNRHPALTTAPKTTQTAEGLAGDPLNVALVGTRREVVHALLASGWYPADPTTFRTSLHIAASVLRGRPYLEAPMSNLYLWGRRQDLAFERPVGSSPRQRHHVRFWRAAEPDGEGRPLWLGAATFDHSVGFSHRTGQVTHHIAADVDAERDQLFADLQQSGQLVEEYRVPGVGPTRQGRNGGGDPYYTDGDISVGVLARTDLTPTDELGYHSSYSFSMGAAGFDGKRVRDGEGAPHCCSRATAYFFLPPRPQFCLSRQVAQDFLDVLMNTEAISCSIFWLPHFGHLSGWCRSCSRCLSCSSKLCMTSNVFRHALHSYS